MPASNNAANGPDAILMIPPEFPVEACDGPYNARNAEFNPGIRTAHAPIDAWPPRPYVDREAGAEALMKQYGIGQPVRRVEDRRFLSGHGHYLDDISRPHQAHAVMLRSPHAH